MLQSELREFVSEALDNWFPTKEFRELSVSVSGLNVLEDLPTVIDFEPEEKSSSDTSGKGNGNPVVGNEEEEDEEDEDYNRRDSVGMTVEGKSKDFMKKKINLDKTMHSKRRWPVGELAVVEKLSELEAAALHGQSDIWALSARQRALLAYAILKRQHQQILNRFSEKKELFENILKENLVLEETRKLAVLKDNKIIGMTLDGHAINAQLIERWGPEVVIVEESAECPFAKVLACLHSSVNHLIQIGDPKQLPPQINTYHLTKHNFAMSMMEIMMNYLPFKTLGRQGRMPPAFRELMQDLYPELQDNERIVCKLAPVDCIEKSVFWWSHSHSQSKQNNTFVNIEEAKMVAKLVEYLLSQGVETAKVTVLAAYSGQVRRIKDELNTLPQFVDGEVSVSTIDQFQGDENDFIIISLVRTGILQGFLANRQGKQRRCVAQSRARRGMYFIGDHTSYQNNPSWVYLITELFRREALAVQLPLICPRHPMCRKLATTITDIPTRTSVCGKFCHQNMNCGNPGHYCKRSCHGGQDSHAETHCCNEVKYLCTTDPSHILSRLCRDKEKVCETMVTFQCTLEHELRRKCSQPEGSIPCEAMVPYRCQSNHINYVECFKLVSGDSTLLPQCEFPCERPISGCNHPCPKKCFEHCIIKSNCKLCREDQRKIECEMRRVAKENYQSKITQLENEHANMDINSILSGIVLEKDVEETAAEYWEVLNGALKNIVLSKNFKSSISQIEKVIQPRAQKAFYQSAVDAKDGSRTITLFISTNEQQIKEILSNGFPTSVGFGKGIYLPVEFTTSDTENQNNNSSGRYAIVCEVLTGKSKSVKSLSELNKMDLKSLRKQNFDSIFIPPGGVQLGRINADDAHSITNSINKGNGYMIYDRRQILLKYIIIYHRLNDSLTALDTPINFGIERKMLRASRVYDENNRDDAHYRVVESQFLSLCIKQGVYRSLNSVELILNSELIRKWNNKQGEFTRSGKGDVILGFHATRNKVDIENIIANNFDPARIGSANGLKYGQGFYFSEFPKKSLGYGSHLLLCKLLIGRSYDVTQLMIGQPLKKGYDSHRFLIGDNNEGRGEELVIPHPDQILPLYILNLSGV